MGRSIVPYTLPRRYDIMKESDPEVRAQLKAEYAAGLTEGWSKQVCASALRLCLDTCS